MNLDLASFEKRFEYLLEEPQLIEREVEERLAWCIDHSFYIHSVAVNHSLLTFSAHRLKGSKILVSAGISYPLGSLPLATARHEAQDALGLGAQQVELVLPAGRVRGGELDAVRHETEQFCREVGQDGIVVLVANLALMENDGKAWCAHLAASVGARLRTNTGFDTLEAVPDIHLVRQAGGSSLEITACGGVNTAEQAYNLFQEGADRAATTHLPAVLQGLETLSSYRGGNHP